MSPTRYGATGISDLSSRLAERRCSKRSRTKRFVSPRSKPSRPIRGVVWRRSGASLLRSAPSRRFACTCRLRSRLWFLAVDFDESSWTEDVNAFAETCRRVGLPAAVERSRSGNGAHAWFFFSSPVPATIARKMGCYLITETMSRRHQLSMESYDRLFPNQDTLPRGGLGNLIALPLQHGPRQMGNTVFVDRQFVPHPDQWKFLSEHPCTEPATA